MEPSSTIKQGLRTVYHLLPVEFTSVIKRQLRSCNDLLDLGCGEKSIVLDIGLGGKTVGVDVYRPYIETHVAKSDYRDCICADINSVDFLSSRFDAVLMLDVLEHLTKGQGEQMLTKVSVWGRKVLVFTPNGYIRNEPGDANAYQNHLSGWTVKELRDRGFKVYGINGLKWLRGEKAMLRFKPVMFWDAVSMATQFATYWIPGLAFHLLAVKEVK